MHLHLVETSIELEIEMDERKAPKKETKEGRQTERRENNSELKKTRIRIPGLY
jgi:hypothetical protein